MNKTLKEQLLEAAERATMGTRAAWWDPAVSSADAFCFVDGFHQSLDEDDDYCPLTNSLLFLLAAEVCEE